MQACLSGCGVCVYIGPVVKWVFSCGWGSVKDLAFNCPRSLYKHRIKNVPWNSIK